MKSPMATIQTKLQSSTLSIFSEAKTKPNQLFEKLAQFLKLHFHPSHPQPYTVLGGGEGGREFKLPASRTPHFRLLAPASLPFFQL